MSLWDRLDRAERLFSRMADRNGADLDMAMQRGELAPEDFRAGVFSCSGCACPDACEKILASGETGIPSFCRNSEMIDRLAELAPD